MYGNGLVEAWGVLRCFGVVWGVSMDRTTVMLTDQLPRAIGNQIHGQFCFALKVNPRYLVPRS